MSYKKSKIEEARDAYMTIYADYVRGREPDRRKVSAAKAKLMRVLNSNKK